MRAVLWRPVGFRNPEPWQADLRISSMEEQMTDFLWACLGPVVVATVLFVFSGFRIIQEYERGIVFRLGKVVRNVNAGLNWVIPGIEQLRKVDIRTMTVPIERQETITRDSVTVKIDAVLWYRIVSPARAILSVADYRNAVHQMALVTLRNIVGQHGLDEVLKERDSINHTLQKIVDDAMAFAQVGAEG